MAAAHQYFAVVGDAHLGLGQGFADAAHLFALAAVERHHAGGFGHAVAFIEGHAQGAEPADLVR